MREPLIIYTNGWAKGNPGPAGIGVVIYRKGVPKPEFLIKDEVGIITNNEAEYLALICGLKQAMESKATEIEVRSGSELIVKQMDGSYRVKNIKLKPLYQEAKNLAERIINLRIKYTSREFFQEFGVLNPEHIQVQIDKRTIVFRLREDRKIQAGIRLTDGAWTFADGLSVLPSRIHVMVFSKWANVLKELEEIINDPSTMEKDLQLFFQQYPELLKGDEYDVIIPQACIIPDKRNETEHPWRADFILSPIDQANFCKILELKKSNQEMIRHHKSGHQRFYESLWEAINQLKDYGEAFNDTAARTKFREIYKIDVFKPDLQLIIGRRWKPIYVEQMLELQKRHHIQLDDWDTHLEKLKRKFT